MERSGPDDARDDAWDDAWNGASGGDDGPVDPHRDDPQRDDPRHDDPLRGFDRFRGFGPFEGFDPFDPTSDQTPGPASGSASPRPFDPGFGTNPFGGDDDEPVELFPPAPVPAHERQWRHPSELGLAAWQQSEPPVAIGRGLLVTTGAIGSVLGVAVLYLMLPAGGASPAASPTATSSTAFTRPSAVATVDIPASSELRADPLGGVSVPDPTTSSSLVWTDAPALTLPAPDTPSTVLVLAAAADPADDPVSVAVAIEGAPYVVTTANAIGLADDEVHLMGPEARTESSPTVEPMDAAVVSIHGDLAFLEPSAAIEVVSFAATAPVVEGQPVTVLGDDRTELTFLTRSVPDLDPSIVVEGTPVVDESGALVALCTVVIDADGAHVELVPVHDPTSDANPVTPDDTVAPAPGDTTPADVTAPPSGATTTTGAPSGPGSTAPTTTAPPSGTTATTGAPATSVPSAWMGLRFDGAPAGAPLTVMGVVAASPASSAGVSVGERIVAVDGVEVRTVADVVAAIRLRAPGEVIRLTLAARTAPTTGGSTTNTTTPPGSATTTTAVATTTTIVPSTTSGAGTNPAGTRVVSLVLASYAPTV